MQLVSSGVAGDTKAGIKERWRDVNAAMTELRDTQCAWTIPDAVLRSNMKDAILEDFVPLYKVIPCPSDPAEQPSVWFRNPLHAPKHTIAFYRNMLSFIQPVKH